MNFDELVDRRGTHCSKWDMMEDWFGVSNTDGLAMWVADSDFKTAPCVLDAVQRAVDHGVFGYFADLGAYNAAIQWWMKTRHGWEVDADWILTAQGLGNAIALSINTWSAPEDEVLIFSPVYHEFAGKIQRTGRTVVESPMQREGDTYHLDFADAEARISPRTKILLFCSPQNPSGRIWSVEELRAVAAFAEKHDLLLISDEIHHDFIMPGHSFVPMDTAAPEARDRLVVLTASSKTFNIAGLKTGNLIIPNETLRAQMQQTQRNIDYSPNRLGLEMVTAAYSPEGAAWVDAQVAYVNENRLLFEAGMDAIPGVHALPLNATYLGWVDFEGTGMSFEEVARRIRKDARVAPSPGPEFGAGGEHFMRFNLATPRARVEEAVARIQLAFKDLQ